MFICALENYYKKALNKYEYFTRFKPDSLEKYLNHIVASSRYRVKCIIIGTIFLLLAFKYLVIDTY